MLCDVAMGSVASCGGVVMLCDVLCYDAVCVGGLHDAVMCCDVVWCVVLCYGVVRWVTLFCYIVPLCVDTLCGVLCCIAICYVVS